MSWLASQVLEEVELEADSCLLVVEMVDLVGHLGSLVRLGQDLEPSLNVLTRMRDGNSVGQDHP